MYKYRKAEMKRYNNGEIIGRSKVQGWKACKVQKVLDRYKTGLLVI